MAKRMIFTLAVMDSIGHNFHGMWRHPQARNREFKKLDLWIDLAKKAEAAKIDALFFTDHLGIKGEFNGSQDIVFEMGVNVPIGDCSMLLSALSQATEHLGFMYTSSVIQHHPFVFARMVSTLDHLSDGRIGWNIVTSANERSFRALGLPPDLSHEDRYAWADEYVDIVYQLWEGSWEKDAVINDAARGIYTDPRKVHSLDHHGKRYRIQGFHLMEPSPQRTPLLIQAGASSAGLDFACRNAEVMFLAAQSPEAAAKSTAQVRQMAREHGRSPDDIQFYQGLTFVVGSTEEEAQRKQRELDEYRSQPAQTAYFTSLTGLDLSFFDPQTPLEDLVEQIPGIRGAFLSAIAAAPAGYKPTVHDFLSNTFKPTTIVGTPEQIADHIQAYQAAGVDGIQILNILMPGTYDEFFEHVTPVLRERGVMQREYAPGVLREKLFGRSGPHLPASHPATRYQRHS